ncbi:hypothetical protein [Nocardia farcinica]|uniref:Uncharacterized protein n=1 Tax=Nocardia farcinica (strain IFM 10152) TaxID=247156 RepID=Q5YSP4_NOCFA|nr:hypothetical protein [Nocardia farcinica]BAD58797.1 hypothetical protein NFA_39490 [Nocardia farcinica IFM 10152]
MTATTCPDCGALLGESTAERMAIHRLWKHPTTEDERQVRADITSTAADFESAHAHGDEFGARLHLDRLRQLVLRAMTYLDDRMESAAQ